MAPYKFSPANTLCDDGPIVKLVSFNIVLLKIALFKNSSTILGGDILYHCVVYSFIIIRMEI